MSDGFYAAHAVGSMIIYFLVFVGCGALPLFLLFAGWRDQVAWAIRATAAQIVGIIALWVAYFTFKPTEFSRIRMGTEVAEGLGLGAGVFTMVGLAGITLGWLGLFGIRRWRARP